MLWWACVLAGVAAGGFAQAADDVVLGPDGYKTLRLGQSQADAEATGLLVDKEPGQTCVFYRLRPEEGQQHPGSGVFVDPAKGVVMIGGTDRSHTPEGIKLRSAKDQVKAAYPDLSPAPPGDFVFTAAAVGSETGAKYRFAFKPNERVNDFGLENADLGGCG